MNAPLIFIHYGPAGYLRWTLQAARKANPEKRILFLGDETNRQFARGLAEYLPFEALTGGEKARQFEQHFQVIQGERHRFNKLHGTDFWLRFVFRRWFLIEALLRQEQFDAFWTFDSDTLVLAPLAPRESRFQDVECTEQCKGECLNGFVGSRQLVERYTDKILELFQRPDYLNAQRERLTRHAGLAFNEMDAYRTFREEEGIRSRHLASILDGETFDDALAFVEGYEPAPDLVRNRTQIKALRVSESGVIYGCHLETGPTRFVTLNLSWMPDFLFSRLARHATATEPPVTAPQTAWAQAKPINLRTPLADRVRTTAEQSLYRLKKLVFPPATP